MEKIRIRNLVQTSRIRNAACEPRITCRLGLFFIVFFEKKAVQPVVILRGEGVCVDLKLSLRWGGGGEGGLSLEQRLYLIFDISHV
jgi:hypothetical protein